MVGNTRISLPLHLALLALGVLLAVSSAAAAVTDTVLNSFIGSDGSSVFAGLTFDQAGNLYGTTQAGGLGFGVVYELTPADGGGWTKTVLYQFGSKAKDGANPYSGVVIDSAGNLYGTTLRGGTRNKGTLYQLKPGPGGSWTETVLHNFGNGPDGAFPIAVPVIVGNSLFGTTYNGGTGTACTLSGKSTTCGTVYQFTSTGAYSIIHNFTNDGNDGFLPVAGLTPDANGNLFGQTTWGSPYGGGLLFQMVLSNGTWTEVAIHPWGRIHDGRPDGAQCYGTLVFDQAGTLWGTSTVGGTHGDLGTVFRFTQNQHGWAEMNAHGFGEPGDGAYPYSGLAVNAAGNLFGTTYQGGTGGVGIVYEIIPGPTGFTYKLLYNFTGKTDGGFPAAPLVMDSAGNFYGTTMWGGDPNHCQKSPVAGCGVAYEISGAQ
ncbi:MAG: choice-of-anchor tandem repeat GloVer-containing protein [Terriglobales bacterium]